MTSDLLFELARLFAREARTASDPATAAHLAEQAEAIHLRAVAEERDQRSSAASALRRRSSLFL